MTTRSACVILCHWIVADPVSWDIKWVEAFSLNTCYWGRIKCHQEQKHSHDCDLPQVGIGHSVSLFMLIFPQWLMCSVTGHLLMTEEQTRRGEGMSRHIPHELFWTFGTIGQTVIYISLHHSQMRIHTAPQSNAIKSTSLMCLWSIMNQTQF